MKRVLSIVMAILLVASLGFVGCGSKEEAKSEPSASESKEAATTGNPALDEYLAKAAEMDTDFKLGFTTTGIANNPFWTATVAQCQEYADKVGIEMMVNDPKQDATAQLEGVENMVAAGIDVLLIDPVDAEGISKYLQEIMDQGVKVVCASGSTENYDTWVTSDQYKVGYMTGQAAADWIKDTYGDKEVSVGTFNYRHMPTNIAREKGYKDALAELAPNVKIAIEGQAADTQEGMKVAENFLQSNPEIVAIIGTNDASVLGAMEAVKADGRADDKFGLFGADSSEEALRKIADGTIMRGTVFLGNDTLAYLIMDTIVRTYNGDTKPKEMVSSEITPVTIDNIEDIMKRMGY